MFISLQSCVAWLAKHALLAWPTKPYALLPAKIRLAVRAKVYHLSQFCDTAVYNASSDEARCSAATLHVMTAQLYAAVTCIAYCSEAGSMSCNCLAILSDVARNGLCLTEFTRTEAASWSPGQHKQQH